MDQLISSTRAAKCNPEGTKIRSSYMWDLIF